MSYIQPFNAASLAAMLRRDLLSLCSGNAERARDAYAFLCKADDAEGLNMRLAIIRVRPIPLDSVEEWDDALRFLEGEDA